MLTKLKNLIKRCVTTSIPVQQEQIQSVNINYMDRKNVTSQVIHDYGYYSCAPIGSIGICINPRAESDDCVSMVYHPKYFGETLKETEVILGNFVKNATLKFDDEGNVALNLPDTLTIVCKNTNISCQSSSLTCDSASIIAGDDITLRAGSSFNLSSPAITLDGPVTAPKGMAVAGGMTSDGIEVSKTDHKHDAGNLHDSTGGACSGETAPDV